MVEVTESDKNCIPARILGAIPRVLHKAAYTAVATHREAAAKAERDRLRELPDEIALEVWINLPAKYEGISKEAMRAIATALADALESKP